MKYLPLTLLLLFIEAVAFSQSSSCVLSKRAVVKNGVLVYEQVNTYNTKQQLIKTKERFLEEKASKYTQTRHFVYDKNGNVIENTLLLNDVFEKTTFRKFDTSNQLVEEAVVSKSGDKATLIQSISGNETRRYNSDGTFTRTVLESDSNGKPTKTTTYDLNGKISAITEFVYTPEGELMKRSTTDILRNRTTETTFKRDNSGSVLEEAVTINAELFSRKVFEVNNTGKITKTAAFNRYNKPDYELLYTYDANGNITSESYFYNNEVITKKENTYDANGNIIQENNLERGKLIGSVTYEYTCF